MSKENTIEYDMAIKEIRKACRQFAMLYFHFSKVLVDEFGEDKAKSLIEKTIFNLAIDRSDKLRDKAQKAGIDFTMEGFSEITDLPMIAWLPELKHDHCPYAETWFDYFKEYPWFEKLAPLYCDVIDTTNAENFTKKLSHKITKNVLTGGESCERIYFPSDKVAKGGFTYGEKDKK